MKSALEVRDLVKVYDRRRLFKGRSGRRSIRAVDGLSFSVRQGQIFGLLGPNGAGKTTTLKILSTLLAPTEGSATVLGYDVESQALEVRRRISVVLQETAVEMFLTARDNLLSFARFHGVKGAEARRRAESVLARFQLSSDADRKVQDLSPGFRRRVQVAKIFMVETPVIFLDEFSTGMDPILKRDVMNWLRQESSKGRTIILTTQVLSEAEDLCDDLLIMNRGKQVARGDLHTLKLLSEGVYEVALSFEQLPDGLEADVTALQPLRLEIRANTIEFAIKAEESRVIELVSELARKGHVLRFEVGGASLEDIFVELTDK